MKKVKERFLPAGVVTAIFAVALISGFFSAPFAAAQEEKSKQKTAQEENARGEHELETMTVTAQKQEENVQEVPISVSVLSGRELEDHNIDGLWKMADFVPNLMIFDTGMSSLFSQPTMRGISAPATTFASSVGLYVDGVPILASPGFATGLLDVERVEVLRGPQGTLYGKNTEAGAINIITRQPDNTLRGKIMAQGGEDKKGLLAATVSGPILEDRLFFSLSGQYDRKDGFVENTLRGEKDDDRQKWYGRGQLCWLPVDNLDMSLIISRLSSDEGGSSMNGSSALFDMLGLPTPPKHEVSSNMEPIRRADDDIQSLKVKYDFSENFSLTSISSRKATDWYAEADFDFSPMTMMHAYLDSEVWRLSQELRLNWESDHFKWLVGLYADKDKVEFKQGNILTGNKTSDRDFNGHSYAVFGQLNYALTDALHVIGGLRYEKQYMDFDDYLLGISEDASWEEVSPKIALKYSFTPQVAAYASVAQGYRSGGFNRATDDPQFKTYDPEKLWSYEIGVKTSFWDNRIILNADVYYMDIKDMQVEEWVTPFITYMTNAAKATGKGGELELQANVARGLSLMAGFGYCDITFDSFQDALGDYAGNDNPFAPEYTFNLGAQYRHYSGFYVRGDLIGYGKMYLDKANKNEKDAYELVNAKIGYETEHFDVYLYAENLFDTNHDTENYWGFYDIYSDPREIGLQLVYRF